MKTPIKAIFLLMLASLVIGSCTKDEVKALLTAGGPLTLTSSGTTIVLEQANANNTALSFGWTEADFGYDAAVTYFLDLSRSGTNFGSNSTTSMNMGTSKSKTFKVGELNAKLLEIVPYGSPQQVDVRVRGEIGSGVTPLYSNVVKITATCYRDIINYSYPYALYIAGNFQGWSPSTAPKIVDKFANTGTNTATNYEGYINFTDASPQFKMVKGPDWSFGDHGSGATAWTLTTSGGPNLTLSDGAGVYKVNANTQALTWSATKITTWGIIGDATPGGWGSSTAMTFNAADGTWTLTTNLTGGKEMKFRANNDWGINLGDNSPRDNKPDYNGSNIPIASDGNYTITLDLGTAGNYAYTIRRN
jgi:hypothetical protein